MCPYGRAGSTPVSGTFLLNIKAIPVQFFTSIGLLLILFTFSCQTQTAENAALMEVNPPAEGFNSAGSDAKAIEIADKVMLAMGGRKAWDDTRVIGWNFMGRRYLIWDKQTGDVRIDVPQDTAVYLLNVAEGTVKAKMKGQEITNIDSLKVLYKKGEAYVDQ